MLTYTFRQERELMELVRLRGFADRAEYEEIIRRIEEEARMKYLEERQRMVETRREREELAKMDAVRKKQEDARAKSDLATARVSSRCSNEFIYRLLMQYMF